MEIKEKIIDISWKTIFKALLTLLVCYFLYLIKNIIAWIIFSAIIAVLFEPLISFLEKKKIPRVIATVLLYTTFFTLLGFFFYWMLPIFISEIQQLTKLSPQHFERGVKPLQDIGIKLFENVGTLSGSLQQWLTEISSNIVRAVISIFGSIFSTITIFTLSVFFSIEKDNIKNLVGLFLSDKNEEYFFDLWKRCQRRTTAWFGAKVLSGLFVGIASYVVLSFFEVRYNFALSVFAGFLDFIPYVGPFIAGLIFGFLTLLDSWTKAVLIIILFTLIQQIEANIVMPLFSKKIIGLPATLTLIALLIGGKLWGVAGAVLSLPLVGIIYELTKDLVKDKKYV